MSQLICIRGYPGQDKTTFANTVFPDIPHFENDMWFMHSGKYEYDRNQMSKAIEWCYSNVEHCLESNVDVAVSNTFTKRKFVESYKNLAEKYGAEFNVYRMIGNFQNVHNVPESILKNMKDNFEDYEGETYVYPNTNQGKDNIVHIPYLLTELKVGDRIEFIVAIPDMMPIPPPIYATVTKICQDGTYDYLNIFYKKDDGKEGICKTKDCKKI